LHQNDIAHGYVLELITRLSATRFFKKENQQWPWWILTGCLSNSNKQIISKESLSFGNIFWIYHWQQIN